MTRTLISCLFAALVMTHAPALAQETSTEAIEPIEATAAAEASYDDVHAFEREWALGLYGTGHAGSYFAGGIGARLRWEPFDESIPLGIEVYLEATLVDWPGGGFRHDYPNGFNLFIPIRIGEDVRLKPYAGFCDILSFVEPEQDGAPRADDVLFGLHAGFGAEFAVHTMFSLFVEAQFNGYMGHERTAEGWTGGVGEEFTFIWNTQLNLGVQFHAGR